MHVHLKNDNQSKLPTHNGRVRTAHLILRFVFVKKLFRTGFPATLTPLIFKKSLALDSLPIYVKVK